MTKCQYFKGDKPSQRSFFARFVVLIAVSSTLFSSPCVLAAESLQTAANAEYPSYTNHLLGSASPYLLAHAHNPVDWYPWGKEALKKAHSENKPIFLSVGYSTCYWCHVAERTLFSNPEIARLMNDWFINIKVDREERPDLDAVYLLANQLLTGGRGGWPNNVFLTPDLEPFYAGGYFSPEGDEFGRPGFPALLTALHEEWAEHPDKVTARAKAIVAVMRQVQSGAVTKSNEVLTSTGLLARARDATLARADPDYGGLGGAHGSTKFPQSPLLELMLADYERTGNAEALRFVTNTLDAMAYGGIHDQLGGGFHRYSVDRTWSVPHFEKMLYDNAQLLALYCRAYRITGNPFYKRTAESVRTYLRREMAVLAGGFYTAQDAAVDGEEGAAYVWTHHQIDALLGEQAPAFWKVYSLTPIAEEPQTLEPDASRGVLRLQRSLPDGPRALASVEAQRRILLTARNERRQPARDEKILIGLNGLAIDALLLSATVLGHPQDLSFAQRSAERIWSIAWKTSTATLNHQIFEGRAQGEGYLDDYALFGRALLSLYKATSNPVWLRRARLVTDALLRRFDADNDGALTTTINSEDLIIVPPEDGDGAYPSGTSSAVDLLERLARATGKEKYAQAAARTIATWKEAMGGKPEMWPTMIAVIDRQAFAASTHATATSQPPVPNQTASHVRATATARQAVDHDEIVVTLEIEKGYHINANPASFDFLIPTSVAFGALSPQAIRYPAPISFQSRFAPDRLNVYEGTVQITASLEKGALNDLQKLRASLNAQACTETVCLPPSQIVFTITVDAR